jgi:peptidyl-Lys metalloendopeptidase
MTKAVTTGQADWRRYTLWFGPRDNPQDSNSRVARVAANFRKLKLAFYPSTSKVNWWVRCGVSLPDAYASVRVESPWFINLDPRYFTVLPQFNWFGGLSQPGALIHEMSHFSAVLHTFDFSAEYAATAQLAINDPEATVLNAESYSYFASNQDGLP